MAGACKFLLIRDPGHRAAEVRALAVQGQKPAILQACQVEVTLAKRSNTARFELLNRAGDLNPGPIPQRYPASAWSQEGRGNPACLEYSQASE